MRLFDCLVIYTIVMVFIGIGFFAGYSYRSYKQPSIDKAERLQIIRSTVESIASIATARVLNSQCIKCHERG